MPRPRILSLLLAAAASLLTTLAVAGPQPNDTLVVSRIQYVNDTTSRPEGFPYIFNGSDVSGVQGNIFLDYLRAMPGPLVATLSLSTAAVVRGQSAITASFSSKSEGALSLSVDGRWLTYSGNSPRAAISVDGTQFYMVGNSTW